MEASSPEKMIAEMAPTQAFVLDGEMVDELIHRYAALGVVLVGGGILFFFAGLVLRPRAQSQKVSDTARHGEQTQHVPDDGTSANADVDDEQFADPEAASSKEEAAEEGPPPTLWEEEGPPPTLWEVTKRDFEQTVEELWECASTRSSRRLHGESTLI